MPSPGCSSQPAPFEDQTPDHHQHNNKPMAHRRLCFHLPGIRIPFSASTFELFFGLPSEVHFDLPPVAPSPSFQSSLGSIPICSPHPASYSRPDAQLWERCGTMAMLSCPSGLS
ncbi:hypothetical protein LY76DRAFT_350820 [Colletotrichum caudatum]|nr:hypothetical protein LY76DRAFT_350820 [Colletotrichum caudatum]